MNNASYSFLLDNDVDVAEYSSNDTHHLWRIEVQFLFTLQLSLAYKEGQFITYTDINLFTTQRYASYNHLQNIIQVFGVPLTHTHRYLLKTLETINNKQ